MTQTINLGTEVYVTDPCYTTDTWCQLKLKDVLPGEWICTMVFDELHGSGRNAELHLVHKDHQHSSDLMYDWVGDFGVDSGQAGVFDAASYRDDATAAGINVPPIDFILPYRDEEGCIWYEAICKFTLSNDRDNWGSYDAGVVSSSGWGDGEYAAYGADNEDGKLVALNLVFIDQSGDLEEDDEDEEDED